jgi:hypothetical protein
MQLRHLPHRRTTTSPEPAARRPAAPADPVPDTAPADARERVDDRVFTVHRVGALGVAAVILVFGLLGFAGGLDFFSTSGEPILGMSSNGLLSTISVITAAVLIFAAVRGPHVASTIMIVVGSLFILSALANMAVLRTDLNLLAFEMSNVFFSAVAGLLLLLLGAYGRLTGNLPPDSPYAPSRPQPAPEPPEYPSTPEEFAAERAMREAEIAVVNHVATAEQRRRVAAMSKVRSRYDRRRVWMEFDAPRT